MYKRQFGTIAIGGFSNHSASVGYFDSVPVEVIMTTFMFLCGFNFALYDKLLRVGPRPFWRSLMGSSEALAYMGIALGATLLVTTVLWLDGGSNGLPQDVTSSLRDYRSFWQACGTRHSRWSLCRPPQATARQTLTPGPSSAVCCAWLWLSLALVPGRRAAASNWCAS